MATKKRAPVVRMTIVETTHPEICTKRFELVDGTLKKETHADVYEGSVEQVEAHGLQGLREILQSLKRNNAAMYGVPPLRQQRLVTERAWIKAGRPANMIPRTSEAINWPSGGGVLMLDYDPSTGHASLGRDELVAQLRRAVPGLADVAMLWWPSASSMIYNAETGEQLTGVRGQRIYLLVQRAADIERAGKAILATLWAAGLGHCIVSKSGSKLERTLFDSSVWQSNRLDFAAGAECVAPLEQRRGAPVLIPGKVELVDTETAIPDPTPEQLKAIATNKQHARETVDHEARIVRERWEAERQDVLTRRLVETEGLDHDTAKLRAVEAVKRAQADHLLGDWPITVRDHAGKRVELTVGNVLDTPHKWHGCKTLDPVEPDYDGGREVGILFLVGARPRLHSKARGERTFKLFRNLGRVEIVGGRHAENVDRALEALRRVPDVFDYGPDIVEVTPSGRLLTINKDNAAYLLSSAAQFWRYKNVPNAGAVEIHIDPPQNICNAVLARGPARGLRVLDTVVSAPVMRDDGTIITTGGYDAGTRLLVNIKDTPPPVPDAPSAEDLRSAWRELWGPFRMFPAVTAEDRAVVVAAVLTAIQRPMLEAAPAFAFDAPRQGTGKSLLAECVSILATGETAKAWPHVSSRNDEEIRKRLGAACSAGDRVILWDNVMGQFDSAAMATFITSSSYTDRRLGTMDNVTYPNKTLVLATGNNFTPGGELQRRFLTCRLDSGLEKPFSRSFDFDPRNVCKARRGEIVAAGLTLLRGFVVAGRPALGSGALGSFEAWDKLIRQAVIWIGREGFTGEDDGWLGDPTAGVTADDSMSQDDEDLLELLRAWIGVYGREAVTARRVADDVGKVRDPMLNPSDDLRRLASAIWSFTSTTSPAPRAVTYTLSNRKDRPLLGMRLEVAPGRSEDGKKWRVVTVK